MDIELPLVFVVELQVPVFRVQWLLILLQAQLPALVDDGMKEIVLLVATTNQLVALTVVDVEKVVCVLAGVLDQFEWEWPVGMGVVCE